MTEKQLWMKADQIADSHNSDAIKCRRMALLLMQAYEENLPLVIMCKYDDSGLAYHAYFNLNEDHPLLDGNRQMIFFTSKRSGKNSPNIVTVPARDVLSNIFNKRVIGGLVFNPFDPTRLVAVEKAALEQLIPGEKPLPPDFVDVEYT